ncbi:MAG TPA: SIR2 family protein [Pyrinomonadaceae bacterium]
MARTKIEEPHWNIIIERIHAGECVPFLGAAVNVRSEKFEYPEGLPLGGEVALRLIEKLIKLQQPTPDKTKEVENDQLKKHPLERLIRIGDVDPADAEVVEAYHKLQAFKLYDDLTRLSLQNLPRVALQVEVTGDYKQLVGYLRDILTYQTYTPSPLLRSLARLPFAKRAREKKEAALMITTNYDELLERALLDQDADNPPKVIVQPLEGFDPVAYEQKRNEIDAHVGLIIYKIHGSFDPQQQWPPLVVTEDHYIQFLTLVGKKDEGIPDRINSMIADHTLLFLGYSLEDWDFRTIYKGLVESLPPYQISRSFAIQKDPPEFWVNYWSNKKVEIYNVDLYDFGQELEQRYFKQYGEDLPEAANP